ncbi:unnamed protein product [Closterium sp. NIES-64]|nr:unnamed protein product [Closterium sp. NIES-64]
MVGPRRGSVEQGREWRRRAGAQRAAAGQGRRKRLGWAAKGGDRAGPRMAARKGPRRAVRLTNSKRAYDAISPTFLPFSPLYHSIRLTGSKKSCDAITTAFLSRPFLIFPHLSLNSRALTGNKRANWVFGAITPTILRALSSPFPQCTPLFAYGQ